MLTAKGGEDDILQGFEAGADDYLVGPLDRTAVLDRVMAVQTSGAARAASRLLELGELTIDLNTWNVYWKGRRLMNPSNARRPLAPTRRIAFLTMIGRSSSFA